MRSVVKHVSGLRKRVRDIALNNMYFESWKAHRYTHTDKRAAARSSGSLLRSCRWFGRHRRITIKLWRGRDATLQHRTGSIASTTGGSGSSSGRNAVSELSNVTGGLIPIFCASMAIIKAHCRCESASPIPQNAQRLRWGPGFQIDRGDPVEGPPTQRG